MSSNVIHLLILGAVAFLAAFATVPVAKRIAFKFNAIDYPGARRVNKIPIPRMGGIAMFFGVFVALTFEMVCESFFTDWTDLYRSSHFLSVNYVGVLLGLSIVTLVGAIDDIRSLSPKVKMLGQIAGAVVIVASGVMLASIKNPFAPGFIEFGWFAYPLTVFYLVAFMNVINLIDGLDGLASGIVGIAAFTLLMIAVGKGRVETALLSVMLLGVTLAFLRYNFAPASIFMGDSGSLFLGAMLGTISLLGVMRAPTVLVLAASLVIAAIPIMDTTVAIIRRLKNHQPIQQADAKHLHHKLLHEGFSPKESVIIIYAWTAFLAFGAYLISNSSGVIVYVLFAALAAGSFLILFRLGVFGLVLRHHYHVRPLQRTRESARSGQDAFED